MKRNKHLVTWALLALCSLCLVSCSDDEATPEPTIDPVAPSTVDDKPWPYDAHMDTSVAPGDNFYMYCLGTWWNNYDLAGSDVYRFCGEESDGYIEQYVARMSSPIIQRVNDDAENIDNTTEAAQAAVEKALAVIADIETDEDAWKAIAEAMKLGYSPIFKLSLMPKARVLKAFLDDPNDEDDDDEEEKTDRNSVKYFSAHPERLDDFVPLSEMRTRSLGNDMLDCIFGQLGVAEADVLVDKAMDAYYNEVRSLSPEAIKERLQNCIMADLCFASHELFEEGKAEYELGETFEQALGNFKQEHMRYIRAHAFATSLGADARKAEMKQICKELIDVFKRRVEALDWMSAPTKAKAIEKLDNIIVNMGYPDKWMDEALPQLTGTSLVENMMQIRAANFRAVKACIGKRSEDMSFNAGILTGSDMDFFLDNAYYNPIDNSINILPIYLMEPYYSDKYSDAFNYSTQASTMAHEITHGLDVAGSKYDAFGNNRNWWTVADKMEFTAREQKLINCFDLLEIMPDELPNVYGNGTKTLGENTADLGGLSLVHQAYVEKLMREGYHGDELLKQERRLFQAYAEQWRAKYTAAHAEQMLKMDVHSLPKERVNGVVMNIDRWYELFDVKFGHTLYLTPETRAHIW